MSGQEVQISGRQSLAIKISKCAELLLLNKEVVITAINSAISAAINLAELLKHKVKNLYQENSIENIASTQSSGPKTRLVIKLSLNSLSQDKPGSQLPIPESEVVEKSLEELKKLPWEVEGAETRAPRNTNYERRRGQRGGRRRSRGNWHIKDTRESEFPAVKGADVGEGKQEERQEEKHDEFRENRRSRRGGRRGGRAGTETGGRRTNYGRGRTGQRRARFDRGREQSHSERHHEESETNKEDDWGEKADFRRSERGRRFRRPRGFRRQNEDTRTGE